MRLLSKLRRTASRALPWRQASAPYVEEPDRAVSSAPVNVEPLRFKERTEAQRRMRGLPSSKSSMSLTLLRAMPNTTSRY